MARSCAIATASCHAASEVPCSAAGAGAEGVLSPASEKMRDDLMLDAE